ncbi:hypothetical protein [Streptomyces sp. WAC08241]|uniref:hypothetical protein n=1 Tax=Streptomyces sp. WAC08241 TaxID=2487421 RepID=UPI000F7B57ED|nr:hypothetical protein [Streptomyces sp. WAC08241]RSS35227.1 hypothetical protein EF906_27910 [Streptomyces sp. WAC08241]
MTGQGDDVASRLTAGARVRIVIEATVESLGHRELELTGGTRIDYTELSGLGMTILENGWQPGDVVEDGYGPLMRVAREDGVHLWQRVNGGRVVYDDETSLASLRVISRAGDGKQTAPSEDDQMT